MQEIAIRKKVLRGTNMMAYAYCYDFLPLVI